MNTKILYFVSDTDDEDEGEDATQSCQASPTLHEHRHPAANGAWGVPLYTADFGLNQKPRSLWPNAHPLDHVGDRISSQIRGYIPQNVPIPQRNRNLKNQNFDPPRIEPRISRLSVSHCDFDH